MIIPKKTWDYFHILYWGANKELQGFARTATWVQLSSPPGYDEWSHLVQPYIPIYTSKGQLSNLSNLSSLIHTHQFHPTESSHAQSCYDTDVFKLHLGKLQVHPVSDVLVRVFVDDCV